MSLPILLNRLEAPMRMRIVLGAALLLSGLLLSGLSGCARGPHWSVASQWGHRPVRTTTLEKSVTLEKRDPSSRNEVAGRADVAGRARVRGSVIVRSGNVFAALVNRRHPKSELSDDPFLNDFLAHAGAHSSGLIEQKTTQDRPTQAVGASSIQEVSAKTVQTRSPLVGNSVPSIANRDHQPPRPQRRNEPADWPSASKTALVADRNQMSRLRTAMKSEDHGTVPSDQSDAHATKVHVGHLMQDVYTLRQKGKLSEAYQTALSAKKLAKTSRLFYGPDEEQPGDLVHQLRRELRAAGHETPADGPSSSIVQPSSTPSQPTVSEPGRFPAGRLSQHRSAEKANEKKLSRPFPKFVPPESSLVVARPAERTSRLRKSLSVEQPATTPAKPAHVKGEPAKGGPAPKKQTLADLKQTLVDVEEALSEHVEILPPAPRLIVSKNPLSSRASRAIARKPVWSVQPRVLTRRNNVSTSFIQPDSSDRPLIVPAQRFLPERSKMGNPRPLQDDQTAADRIRQTSLTANARSIWNRQEEPAVLLSSLSTMPANNASVRPVSRQPMRPAPNWAPAPPVELSKSDPAKEALLSPPNPRSNGQRPRTRIRTRIRTAVAKASASKAVPTGSLDWNGHAGFDDNHAASVGQSLLWLALAVLTGLLMGVFIRVWARFRRKPILSGTMADEKAVRDGVICDL